MLNSHQDNNLKPLICKIVEILFIFFVSVILVSCLTKPSQNQLPKQIIPLTVAAGLMMYILFIILKYLCQKFPFITTKKFFAILSIIYAGIMVLISLTNRNSPASFYDYEICYNSALEYAKTGAISYPMYFSMNPHNWKCTLVLSMIMKISIALKMNDPFLLIIVANLIIIFSVLYSCRYLLIAFFPEEKHLSLMLLFSFVTCLPIYAYVQAFYSDGASLGGAITGLALAHFATSRIKKKSIRIIVLFVSGVILAFSAVMKVTSMISVIAIILYYIFIYMSEKIRFKKEHSLKKATAYAIIISLGFITFYAISELICNRSNWYTESSIYNTPAISYVAMGLKENGTYFENREFRQYLDSLTFRKNKSEYSIEYIKENASFFLDYNHLVKKIRANYASGVLGASDFAYYGYDKDTVLCRIFNPYGDLYWNGSKYCMIWIFQIYLLMLIVAVKNLFSKEKQFCPLITISELTFIGYFLFLLIWEANNRQLYNMLPVLLIGYVVMLKDILKINKSQK